MTTQSVNQTSTSHSQTAPIQWRFLWVFAIGISPMIVWPTALNGTNPTWALICSWMPLFSVHAIIPLLDWLTPPDVRPPIKGQTHWFNRCLPMLCFPLWLAALFATCFQLTGTEFQQANSSYPGWLRTLQLVGVVLSLGAIGGILSINPAHELIHRNSKLERGIGGLLLAAVSYAAFKIEHVRGHHLHVATGKDTASAQRGQNVFAFAIRSFFGTIINAHQLEWARLEKKEINPLTPAGLIQNELLWLNGFSLMLFGAFWFIAGWMGAIVFIGASLGAIFQLEVINFIEHYGLSRKIDETSGRFETVKPIHSWNTSTAVGNVFLFNLQRHSDHHAHAGKDYLHLENITDAPQLPYGYGAMYLIAFVPPLWRKVMHPRLDTLAEQAKAKNV